MTDQAISIYKSIYPSTLIRWVLETSFMLKVYYVQFVIESIVKMWFVLVGKLMIFQQVLVGTLSHLMPVGDSDKRLLTSLLFCLGEWTMTVPIQRLILNHNGTSLLCNVFKVSNNYVNYIFCHRLYLKSKKKLIL